ncbi:MFS transporter [Chryseobacterium pennae]|uniref:MFS transporter n=2 Tax=Chryseobacterium group TaxID=2782232 RepID=A0A3D9CAP2_9FLAO|nr:MFS transporter [Chryseobacterium pennae]
MKILKLPNSIAVMFSFFVMGYVDLVGIATNNIKIDFGLTDTIANLLPSMVFLWFLVFSVPTGIMMNKIGRKKTVLLSLAVTFLAVITPLIGYSFPIMLISFALLGIGNTLMQVSLNPLVTNIIKGEKLASALTFGQFIKAIASFLAPIISSWAAINFGNWRLLFPMFATISLISFVLLYFTSIEEKSGEDKMSSFKDCLGLLADKTILMLFIGILVHVGIDVGVNITAPKLLMERVGMNLQDASYGIVLYFISRTIGTFSGTFILSLIPSRVFFMVSALLMVVGVMGLFFAETGMLLYICIVLLGIGNSNVFSIIFSTAMQLIPSRNNEISGLMIMGISGGAIFPFFMGILSDSLKSQQGAVIILLFCIIYLLSICRKIK